MLYSTLVVAFSAFAGLVSAQANFTTCCNVTPTTVDSNKRLSWCRAQQNTCPETCTNGATSANSCDANTLIYNCTCLTGTTPNITDYAQTLPSLECDEWKAQCTAAHPNDLAGQNFCQSFTCGKKNASAQAAAASSASSSSHATTATSATSAGGSATASSTAKAAAVKVAREFGTAGLAFGMFAVFGLAL